MSSRVWNKTTGAVSIRNDRSPIEEKPVETFYYGSFKTDIFVENNDNGISLICEIRYVININTVYWFYIWKIVGLKLK